jgi:hypothetical protein
MDGATSDKSMENIVTSFVEYTGVKEADLA